jgi:hypothetical protein
MKWDRSEYATNIATYYLQEEFLKKIIHTDLEKIDIEIFGANHALTNVPIVIILFK